ncbi:85/ calcium-independent phospholipase A2 [Araneus ventricosus]|uniref:85/ calcium-independent phospholipase A2 n=1 Tax=Araneus ventricosus TaxID=182803 RepID=A0A4Y2LHA3_ARAVE|nr:85/ calcium-independent phospholipase A2 [Araneus ventricosus]
MAPHHFILLPPLQRNNSSQKIWEVARAAGATPPYFCPMGPFIDGALVSNDPMFSALTEILEFNNVFQKTCQNDKIRRMKLIVSMGTGRPPNVPVTTDDVSEVAAVLNNVDQLFLNQVTQTDGSVIARAMCSLLNIPYFRLNPQLTLDVALDETDPKILVKILFETKVYMRFIEKDLKDLKNLLTT